MSISAEVSKVGAATIDVSVSGGEAKSFPSGITAREVLQQCGVDRPDVFAVSVDKVPMDLSTPLTQNSSLEPISFSSPQLRLRGKGRPINTLQHGIPFIASPIGTSTRQEL